MFNALRSQNLELPGGNLNAGAKEFTVRTTGRVTDAAQFNQIAIANRNGYVVKVSDIGYAEDSYEEPRSAARLDGVPAVTLVVAKQSGENTVATADEVQAAAQGNHPPRCRKDVQRAGHQRSVASSSKPRWRTSSAT